MPIMGESRMIFAYMEDFLLGDFHYPWEEIQFKLLVGYLGQISHLIM